MRIRFARSIPFVSLLLLHCGDHPHPGDASDAAVDSGVDVPGVDMGIDRVTPPDDVPQDTGNDAVTPVDVIVDEDAPVDAPTGPTFCSMGGAAVPGAIVPSGFCLHQFAGHAMSSDANRIVGPRTMAFASNGDLFVAAPASGAPGGSGGGMGAILLLTDANHDNQGELHVFASGIPDVHGLAVTNDAIYFTTANGVWRTDYAPGQQAEVTTSRTRLAMLDSTTSSVRWTHGLFRSAGGHLYVTTGVYGSSCPDPNVGTIHEVTTGGLRLVAQGFRNPMYGRCHFRDEVCGVSELGDDGGGSSGAREKLLLLHDATNYGYPCCAGPNQPLFGGAASCASVTAEEAQMALNDTPFGLDWEQGSWPSPYRRGVFVAKHGSFYASWHNVGIWWAPTDVVTHAPTGAFTLLVDGFGITTPQLRRPADVAFAPDGRMFFVDDIGGGVYWLAPDTLRSR